MNKSDLVQQIREKTSLSMAESEKAVNAMLESISTALSKKEDVNFVGFGSFVTVKREARTGRNPQTGASLQIPASTQVKFRPGKTLKERVTA